MKRTPEERERERADAAKRKEKRAQERAERKTEKDRWTSLKVHLVTQYDLERGQLAEAYKNAGCKVGDLLHTLPSGEHHNLGAEVYVVPLRAGRGWYETDSETGRKVSAGLSGRDLDDIPIGLPHNVWHSVSFCFIHALPLEPWKSQSWFRGQIFLGESKAARGLWERVDELCLDDSVVGRKMFSLRIIPRSFTKEFSNQVITYPTYVFSDTGIEADAEISEMVESERAERENVTRILAAKERKAEREANFLEASQASSDMPSNN